MWKKMRRIQLLRAELECLKQSHLKQSEDTLQVKHTKEFVTVMIDPISLEKLKKKINKESIRYKNLMPQFCRKKNSSYRS